MVMATKHSLTTADVEKIAKLSNIKLTPSELEFFAQAFSDTLSYIKILDELDTTDVIPTFQVNGLINVFQSKGDRTTLSQEEALQNAKNVLKERFATKGVFDREH